MDGEGRAESREFAPADIGALAHLHRGEVHRSTIRRTRLDTTANWSVVTPAAPPSIAFASAGASPPPLVPVGVPIAFFPAVEARRHRHAHPSPLGSREDPWFRAAVGPVPGEVMVAAAALYGAGRPALAPHAYRLDVARRRDTRTRVATG